MTENFTNNIKQLSEELKSLTDYVKQLMCIPYYKKLGENHVFLVSECAISLGVDPRKALSQGLLYSVRGKIEMSGRMMSELVRKAGHSVSVVSSNNDKCVLKGKRSDNGDEAEGSFSIDDAKQAGIYKDSFTWSKFPRDMLYWRAFSQLCRRLFADVIGGCYIEGELRDGVSVDPAPINEEKIETKTLTEDQVKDIKSSLEKFPNEKEQTENILKYARVNCLSEIHQSRFDSLKNYIKNLAITSKA